MSDQRTDARRQFRRSMLWIVITGVLLTIGALWYLSVVGEFTVASVAATIGGVFLSILLGCGLFALAFYSDRSGHDERSRDATDHIRR